MTFEEFYIEALPWEDWDTEDFYDRETLTQILQGIIVWVRDRKKSALSDASFYQRWESLQFIFSLAEAELTRMSDEDFGDFRKTQEEFFEILPKAENSPWNQLPDSKDYFKLEHIYGIDLSRFTVTYTLVHSNSPLVAPFKSWLQEMQAYWSLTTRLARWAHTKAEGTLDLNEAYSLREMTEEEKKKWRYLEILFQFCNECTSNSDDAPFLNDCAQRMGYSRFNPRSKKVQ